MKETLQNKLNKIKEAIVNICSDKEEGKRLVDDLLSLKGQADIEPTLVHIPTSYIIKEYDNDNIVIYRCKDCIIWRMKGGETKIVYPTMVGEYQFLSQMLDMREKYDTLDEDLKTVYDSSYLGYSILNTIPSIITAKDKYFVEAVKWGMDFTARMYDEIIAHPLQDETPEDNAAHEAKMQAIDIIFKKDKNDQNGDKNH